MINTKRICVIGLGYIGLPTAALLASKGYAVAGIDLNPDTVQIINQGKIHIVEPDLDACVQLAVSSGRLKAYLEPQLADIYLICVPTPLRSDTVRGIPQPDIEYVRAAVSALIPLLKMGDMLIIESTSPVGTTQAMASMLEVEGVDISKIAIAYCPERVLPGKIMTELLENDRVVGGLNITAAESVADFYKTFVRGEVITTDAPTAEMCKLAENSYRDVNIAFANELSLISAKAGIDVWRLIDLANRHPRVNILTPGVGVGGHCIAVDPWFIVAKDPKNAQLIHAARQVNDRKTQWVVEQIQDAVTQAAVQLQRIPKVACLGLAFKPDIDDLRGSPAIEIVKLVAKMPCELMVVEPNIDEHVNFDLVDLMLAIQKADLLIILVKHRQFIAALKQHLMPREKILDFCGI